MRNWRIGAMAVIVAAVAIAGCGSSATSGSNATSGTPRHGRAAHGRAIAAKLTASVSAGPGSAAALAHGHWSVLARSPLGDRGATLVAVAGKLFDIGANNGGRCATAKTWEQQGAAYMPASSRWRRIAPAPASVLVGCGIASVWTGKRLFVAGSVGADHEPNVAGLYDPSTNRWTVTSRAPAGTLCNANAVRVDGRVILAGTGCETPSRLHVVSYDPARNSWTTLHPPVSSQHISAETAMVRTNDGVLLWSLWQRLGQVRRHHAGAYFGVDVVRLSAGGVWSNVTGNWPQFTSVEDPLFTGTQVILPPQQLWCGGCSPGFAPYGRSYLVNPKTLARRAVPRGPLDAAGPQILWSGSAIVAFDNDGPYISGHTKILNGDIAFWNPVTRRWSRGPRAPKSLTETEAVWSGAHLYALAASGQLLSYGR